MPLKIDEELFNTLKELQVATLKHYDYAKDNGESLASDLLPDAWNNELEKAKEKIKQLINEARIDELKSIPRYANPPWKGKVPKDRSTDTYLEERISELTENSPSR